MMLLSRRSSNYIITQSKRYALIFIYLVFNNLTGIYARNEGSLKPFEIRQYTQELIEVNLKDCRKDKVWLEGVALQNVSLLKSFYEINNYKPIWTRGDKISPQARALILLFHDAYKYGIEPAILNIEELETYVVDLASADKDDKLIRSRASFDFLMSNSAFTFMLYLKEGAQAVSTNANKKVHQGFNHYYSNFLAGIYNAENIVDEILSLQPGTPEYISIQTEMEYLVNYLELLEKPVKFNKQITEKVLYHQMFSYIIKVTGLPFEFADPLNPLEYKEAICEVQKYLNLRVNGKLNLLTCNTISILISSRYAELAYQMEMIRTNSRQYARLEILPVSF